MISDTKLTVMDATDAKPPANSTSRRPESNGRRPGPGFGQNPYNKQFKLYFAYPSNRAGIIHTHVQKLNPAIYMIEWIMNFVGVFVRGGPAWVSPASFTRVCEPLVHSGFIALNPGLNALALAADGLATLHQEAARQPLAACVFRSGQLRIMRYRRLYKIYILYTHAKSNFRYIHIYSTFHNNDLPPRESPSG